MASVFNGLSSGVRNPTQRTGLPGNRIQTTPIWSAIVFRKSRRVRVFKRVARTSYAAGRRSGASGKRRDMAETLNATLLERT